MLRPGVVCTLMAKFLYSAAMSLDGFIAGPGGDVSWMVDSLGPNPVVDELITRTGAILVGNRTFGGDDPYKGAGGRGRGLRRRLGRPAVRADASTTQRADARGDFL